LFTNGIVFMSSRMPTFSSKVREAGFTLIELLVVITIISILAALLLPALSKSRERVIALNCLNNVEQLELGCSIYAGDFGDRLPYNLGMVGSERRTDLNWVNNVMTWDLSSDNTNLATLTQAGLGAFVGGNTRIYRCPSDHALSSVQTAAGWAKRIRSYSMNAMIGDAGNFSTNGYNINNPGYVQFFKTTQIPNPSEIFVFLDEHPDSINDGYFLNKSPYYSGNYSGNLSKAKWTDLPASYHNGAAAFSFVDGHAALHRWTDPGTSPAPQPTAAGQSFALSIAPNARTDFDWVIQHMSIGN
jgi:prepilin-type N-terminal cleavage/methylation domain-containing protein/prepilin-type processing-associated H-X9-DG protein